MFLCNIPFSDDCRHLEFGAKELFLGQRLMNHVIRSADVSNEDFCGALCFMEPNCVSYNLMTKNENGKHKCELNNATYEEHKNDMEEDPNYEHRGAKVKAKAIQKMKFTLQTPVIQKAEGLYLPDTSLIVDSAVCFANTNPLDSDLSGG